MMTACLPALGCTVCFVMRSIIPPKLSHEETCQEKEEEKEDTRRCKHNLNSIYPKQKNMSI